MFKVGKFLVLVLVSELGYSMATGSPLHTLQWSSL